MTEALGVLAALVGLTLIGLAVHFLIQLWHDWAEDRAREAEYAAEWQRLHKAHQDVGRFDARDTKPNRYLHADDRSPE